MSPVSNERAQEIRECVDAQDLVAETFGVNLKTSLMIAELLADREERKRDKEAVIAKIEKWIEGLTQTRDATLEEYKKTGDRIHKMVANSLETRITDYRDALALIRNPKEAE